MSRAGHGAVAGRSSALCWCRLWLRCDAGSHRAGYPRPRRHSAIPLTITSEALITAIALSPTASARSSMASFVIEDVMMMPLPMSIWTCPVVWPFLHGNDLAFDLISGAQLHPWSSVVVALDLRCCQPYRSTRKIPSGYYPFASVPSLPDHLLSVPVLRVERPDRARCRSDDICGCEVQPAASRLLDFLASAPAKTIFEKHGFTTGVECLTACRGGSVGYARGICAANDLRRDRDVSCSRG